MDTEVIARRSYRLRQHRRQETPRVRIANTVCKLRMRDRRSCISSCGFSAYRRYASSAGNKAYRLGGMRIDVSEIFPGVVGKTVRETMDVMMGVG